MNWMSEHSNGQQLLMANEIDFSDLTPIEVPVKIGSNKYVLKEATAGAARKYKSASLQGATMELDGTGVSTLRNFGGIGGAESLLISLCLRQVDGDVTRSVSQATIEEWPVKVQTALFERIEEISPGLNVAETLPVLRKQLEKLQAKIKRLEDADPQLVQMKG